MEILIFVAGVLIGALWTLVAIALYVRHKQKQMAEQINAMLADPSLLSALGMMGDDTENNV